jgi:hypothetical protein
MGTEHLGNAIGSGNTSYTPLPTTDQNEPNAKVATQTLFAPSDELDTSLSQLSPFNFGQTGQPVYDTAGQHTVLPVPQEAEVSDATLGKMEQLLINSQFINQVKSLLIGQNVDSSSAKQILKYIRTGNEAGLSSASKKLADQVFSTAVSNTQTSMDLTADWNPRSNPNTWQTKPPVTYNAEERIAINQFFDERLTETTASYINNALKKVPPTLTQDQATALQTALKSNTFDPLLGPDPHLIANDYAAIRKQAIDSTQMKYPLPSTWTPGTSETSQYTAVNTSPINPVGVQTAQFKQLMANVQQLAKDYSTTIEKLKTDPNQALQKAASSPDAANVIDFMKAILSSLTAAKEMLHKLQVEDAELSQKLSASKFDATNQRLAQEKEEWSKNMEQIMNAKAAEKKQSEFGGIMKILSPVVAALAFVVAVLVTAASFGTLTAAGVAIAAVGLTLSAAMLAYTIADSVCNISPGVNAAIMGAFKTVVDGLAKGLEAMGVPSKVADPLAKAILLVIVAAIIIAAVVASGGTAAVNAGATAATEAAQVGIQAGVQILKSAITQILMQFLMVIVMSPDSGIAALILEAIPNASAKTKLIVQMIVMAVFMVAIMAAGAIKQAGGLGKLISNITSSVKSAATSIAETMKSIMDSIVQGIREGLQTGLSSMENIIDRVQEAAKDILRSIMNTVREILRDMLPATEKSGDIMRSAQAWAERAQLVGQVGMQAVTISKGVTMHALDMSLAKLLEQLGEIQAAEEVLQGMIQMLEKMIQKMQQAMGGVGENLENVQDILKHAFLSSGQSFQKLATSVNPA